MPIDEEKKSIDNTAQIEYSHKDTVGYFTIDRDDLPNVIKLGPWHMADGYIMNSKRQRLHHIITQPIIS